MRKQHETTYSTDFVGHRPLVLDPSTKHKARPILRARLKAVPAGAFEVWVTHQVNITALTGEFTAMGEALIVDASGVLLARTTLS